MKKYNRIFVIVLDSLGIGAMPDSERFGDTDVDTLDIYLRGCRLWTSQILQGLGCSICTVAVRCSRLLSQSADLRGWQRRATARTR